MCLLSTRNLAFVRLLGQSITLRAQFRDYIIKTIRFDNANEFTSQAFNDYCMSLKINIEHHVAHIHIQNGLVELLLKHLQLIARSLHMWTKLLVSTWGHIVLHAATLIHIRPTTYHKFSLLKLVFRSWAKHYPSKNIWLCGICFNLSATTYKDGSSKEARNIYWVWVPINN